LLINIDLNAPILNPEIYLCKPDKTKIAKLKNMYNAELVLSLDDISELNFDVPYQVEIQHELKRYPYVDLIRNRYIIYLKLGNYEEYFLIKPALEDKMEEKSEYKHVECYGLAIELADKNIVNYTCTSFNATNVLTVLLKSAYGMNDLSDCLWTIGYINPIFNNTFRSFEIFDSSLLDFIQNNLSETFDAIPIFDTINRTISLYSKDDIGIDRRFRLKYGQYLKTLSHAIDNDDFCTRLKLFGEDDLSIQEVNPTGQNYIQDFSYFINPYTEDELGNILTHSYYMSDSLCHAILVYDKLLISKSGITDTAESGTTTTNITMTAHGLTTGDYIINRSRDNESRIVTVVDSNNITVEAITDQTQDDKILKYRDGTHRKLLLQKTALQTELTALENDLTNLTNELEIILDALAVAEETGTDTTTLITQRNAKQAEVDAKELEITNKETEITNKNDELTALITSLSMASNFTTTQLKELQKFIIEDTLSDTDYYNADDLYFYGIEKLAERNTPQINIDINIINFLRCITEQRNWDKLNLGDYITIEHENLGIDVKAQITKISFNFEDNDIDLTISNVTNLALNDEDKIIKRLSDAEDTTKTLNSSKSSWDLTAQNFNSNNDRISTLPADPIIPSDGTALDYVQNTDGSVNISFEWSYNGIGDAYNIDGFYIFVRSTSSSNSYTFGSTIAKEQVFSVNAEKRAFILNGVASDQYYTFGVQAYRIVDTDINSNGILKSGVVKSIFASENPYLPSADVIFGGKISNGTDSLSANEVIEVATNTATYRNTGVPTNNPSPATIDVNTNTDGSIDIILGWSTYIQGTKTADNLILYYKTGTTSGLGTPIKTNSSITLTTTTTSYTFSGLASDKYYSFGIAAARKTNNGLEVGTIQSSTFTPQWQDVTNGTPDYLGNVNSDANVSNKTAGAITDAIDGFGDGSNGEFNSTGNFIYTVTSEDNYSVIKQYTNFTLNYGHTLTTDKRCRGVFIFVRGNAVINGTINMNGKSGKTSKDYSSQRIIQIPIGTVLIDIPSGGNGGNGGNGGTSDNINTPIALGSSGTLGIWYGGGFGGAGAGGAGGYCDRGTYSGKVGGNAGTSLLDNTIGNSGTGGIWNNAVPTSGGTGGNFCGGGGGSGTNYTNGTGGNGGGGAGIKGGKGGSTSDNTPTAENGDSNGGIGGGLVVLIVKGNITINGSILCNGLNGGNGGDGTNGNSEDTYSVGGSGGGGQGGGGGGVVILVHKGTYTNNGTISVNAGTGGTGGTYGTGILNNGSSGSNGSSGTIGNIIVAQV
jgi:hypothetical protein